MANWRDRAKTWLMRKTALPADALLDLPRVTMIGNIHVYIENHNGLIQFSNEELRLALKQGQQMQIKGNNFIIKTILPEEILLEGKVEQILYLDQ